MGRGNEVDSADARQLYAVIGHAPRQLDRNITVVGRVLRGMEHLASLPRGTGAMGYLQEPQTGVRVVKARVAADLAAADRPSIEVLRTDTDRFQELIESRRNRRDTWYTQPAGHIEVCNVPIPLRD